MQNVVLSFDSPDHIQMFQNREINFGEVHRAHRAKLAKNIFTGLTVV